MKVRLSLIGLFSLAILTMGLVFCGFILAQHEGGLGEKKVPLNIATEEQLMKIEGMTPELAKAIVESTSLNGSTSGGPLISPLLQDCSIR